MICIYGEIKLSCLLIYVLIFVYFTLLWEGLLWKLNYEIHTHDNNFNLLTFGALLILTE